MLSRWSMISVYIFIGLMIFVTWTKSPITMLINNYLWWFGFDIIWNWFHSTGWINNWFNHFYSTFSFSWWLWNICNLSHIISWILPIEPCFILCINDLYWTVVRICNIVFSIVILWYFNCWVNSWGIKWTIYLLN